MNTARFCQFHNVWGNKWSFCSKEKETGTMISSRILCWVPLPYELDTGTLCLLQILQTRLFPFSTVVGMIVGATSSLKNMLKSYDYWKKSQITDISNFCYWLHQKGVDIYALGCNGKNHKKVFLILNQ
jgi:hypothetical protein